jgi:hypothetical protein
MITASFEKQQQKIVQHTNKKCFHYICSGNFNSFFHVCLAFHNFYMPCFWHFICDFCTLLVDKLITLENLSSLICWWQNGSWCSKSGSSWQQFYLDRKFMALQDLFEYCHVFANSSGFCYHLQKNKDDKSSVNRGKFYCSFVDKQIIHQHWVKSTCNFALGFTMCSHKNTKYSVWKKLMHALHTTTH